MVAFVRSAGKLTHVKEEAIYELSNMNQGPVKAFNLMRKRYGGFEKVGATKDDCKNFKQGLNCYIGEYNVEMIVQRLCAKRTFSSDYSFEYDVNDDREYKMVFAPFTTIDNHYHSVISFGSAPKVVVTDQDPTMKQAIASVFPNTRHRLCMWHIMKKVADKRYNGRRCDHDSRYTYPQLETRSYLEREAVRIYTRSIFNVVQDEMNEIVGGVSQFSSCEDEGGFLRCKIMDLNAYVPGFLEVVFKKEGEFGEESTATCSCKRFEQCGLLCRHIFYVMNMYQVKKFPKKYINDRWRKEVVVNIRTVPMSEFGNYQNRKIKEISREIKYAGEYLINSYVADIDKLIKVRDGMNLMIEKADITRYERVRPSKRDRLAVVLGFEQPLEVTVRVPTGIRNKGRGSHKRCKSKKEIAISQSRKSYM
ncbi:protein FAR1-RELATED SEQUENCE 5-like [Bidens hawaiensis]|uniref:protein FAR1-RELATED SEQUENCE 5-like n=1 Tax=Bidens hawaiensis TaxID=980011 RepID=UPI0040495095